MRGFFLLNFQRLQVKEMWLDRTGRSSLLQNISLKFSKTASSKKLPAKAILKVFPAVGEFAENLVRLKTFDINF